MNPYASWGEEYARKKKKQFGTVYTDDRAKQLPGLGTAFTKKGRGLAKAPKGVDMVKTQSALLENIRSRALEHYLDKGWSYKDIAKNIGLDEDKIREHADKTRPGYGVTPSNLEKAGEVGKGILDEIGETTSNIISNIPLIGSDRPDNFGGNVAEKLKILEQRPDAQQLKDLGKDKDPSVQATIINLAAQGMSLEGIQKETALREQRISENDKKLAGDVAEVASFAVPIGGGAKAFMQGKKALAKATAVSAGGGYAGSAGYQLSEDPTRTLVDVATDPTNLAVGAGTALFPVAGYGLRKLKVGRAVKEVTDQMDAGTLPISDYSQKMIQKSIQEKGKYSRGTWGKVSDVLKREVFDPLNKLQKSDRMVAKAEGKKLEKLIGEGRSLAEMVQKTQYRNLILQQIKEAPHEVVDASGKKVKRSLADLIKDYGVDTDAERQLTRYAQNKHILDVAAQDSKNLTPQLREQLDSIKAAVDDYEKINPNAIRDAQVKKKYYDSVLDYAADLNVLSREGVEYTKKKYPNYHPLIPEKPEDLVRPEISGGLGFSVGKQDIVKSLKNLTDIPLKTSFEDDLIYIDSAIGKSLKSQIGQELERRIKAGHLDKFALKVDPDAVRAARELRGIHKLLVGEAEATQKQLGKKVSQLRVQNAYTEPLRKKAAKATRDYLAKTLDDPDALAASKSLTDKQALDLFQTITGDADIEALRKSLIKKGAPTQRLLDELENLRVHYGETAVKKQDVFNQIGELGQENVKNQNTLSFLRGGEVGKIELPPDWADTFSYLATKDRKNAVTAILKGGADLQKFLYTGPGNPVFQLIQPLKNTGVMFTNSRRMSPFGARAIAQAFRPGGQFKQQMIARGYIPETFTKTPSNAANSAAKIAAKGGVFKRAKYTVKNPILATKDFFHTLNGLGAILNNQQRMQVAKGSYQYAKNRGFTEEQALNLAARDANEILGNFNRVSKLAKAAEPVFLYSGATQAGLRPLFQAMRDRPIETSVKLTAVSGVMGAFAYANLSSEKGQEYYQDMIDSGNWYNLTNFMTYVFPWAEKNEKGEWGGSKDIEVGGKSFSLPGVIKTPIAPDFRPINKAVTEVAYNFTKEEGQEGFSPVQIAQEAFNLVTGGMFTAQDSTGISLKNTIKQSGPYKSVATAFNKDPETGDELSKQNTTFTSETGKRISELLGGRVSANQVDQLLRQGGRIGADLANDDQNLLQSYTSSFKGQFIGGKSKSDKQKNWEQKQNIIRGLDEATRKRYEGRHAIERDEDGEVDFGGSSIFASVKRAGEYLLDIEQNEGKDFELEKRLARIDQKNLGKPIHPILTLNKKQAAELFMSQVGEEIELYDKSWYKQYQKKYDSYLGSKKKWNEKNGYEFKEPADPYPKAGGSLQRKLDYYGKLPENDGPRGGNKTRSLYIQANPEIGNYFDRLRRWRNRRKLLKTLRTGVDLPLEIDEYEGRPLY